MGCREKKNFDSSCIECWLLTTSLNRNASLNVFFEKKLHFFDPASIEPEAIKIFFYRRQVSKFTETITPDF